MLIITRGWSHALSRTGEIGDEEKTARTRSLKREDGDDTTTQAGGGGGAEERRRSGKRRKGRPWMDTDI